MQLQVLHERHCHRGSTPCIVSAFSRPSDVSSCRFHRTSKDRTFRKGWEGWCGDAASARLSFLFAFATSLVLSVRSTALPPHAHLPRPAETRAMRDVAAAIAKSGSSAQRRREWRVQTEPFSGSKGRRSSNRKGRSPGSMGIDPMAQVAMWVSQMPMEGKEQADGCLVKRVLHCYAKDV